MIYWNIKQPIIIRATKLGPRTLPELVVVLAGFLVVVVGILLVVVEGFLVVVGVGFLVAPLVFFHSGPVQIEKKNLSYLI